MQYKIRERRDEIGISQEKLSKLSGVSRTIISGLESGSIKVTTTDTLIRISEALDCKVKDIFLQ